MKSILKKNTFREIRQSFGRYFAMFAIVALGVIMFVGLKVCRSDMVVTADKYFNDTNMFDYRLISTSGFEKDDVNNFTSIDDVKYAESGINLDVITTLMDNKEIVMSMYSLTDNINQPVLKFGRLPENDNECIVDADYFDEADIGTELIISDTNLETTKSMLKYDTYKIVGIAKSPLYLNNERGTSSVGNGKVMAFVYVLRDGFVSDYENVIYIKMNTEDMIYSDDYENYIKEHKDEIKNITEDIVITRYEDLKNMGAPIEEPLIYVLDRNTNAGYVSFDNDSNIVNQVAAVFPIFFFAVAALICMTTMTRMVEEERTQIGIMKALGYRESVVATKYLFYSGSAAITGAICGYLIGSILFPKIIWIAYGMIYDFAPLTYVWDIKLGVISLVASVICSMGATYISCASQFRSSPAELIRPKAPKNGKTILLEKVSFIWNRLSFLHKVSIRNVFRYKKRFIMMILGISGCTALVVAALGLLDSFGDIVGVQFDKIAVYDATISLNKEDALQDIDEYFDSYAYLYTTSVDIEDEDKTRTSNLVVAKDEDEFEKQYRFLKPNSEEQFGYPNKNEAVITKKLSEKLNINIGDTITFSDANHNEYELKVSGICRNFIYSYVFINKETYKECTNDTLEYKTVYAKFNDKNDADVIVSDLLKMDNVSSVDVNKDMRDSFNDMMSSLDYVIILIIFMAAALAFIVLYNLTNINITERIREIATIKVLGFYPKEISAYVFRENFILTAFGACFGLLLGKWLLTFVVKCIDVDMIAFESRISAISYIEAVLITFGFAIFVNLIMYNKLKKINMVESLKSVE